MELFCSVRRDVHSGSQEGNTLEGPCRCWSSCAEPNVPESCSLQLSKSTFFSSILSWELAAAAHDPHDLSEQPATPGIFSKCTDNWKLGGVSRMFHKLSKSFYLRLFAEMFYQRLRFFFRISCGLSSNRGAMSVDHSHDPDLRSGKWHSQKIGKGIPSRTLRWRLFRTRCPLGILALLNACYST